MRISRLDIIYRKILITKFFTKGWGSAENIIELFKFRRRMSDRETCYNLVPKDYPVQIINEQTRSDCRIIDGKFRSPFLLHMSGLMVPETHEAFFQMVLPLKWPSDQYRPVCIHLAGTGDHYFWRRRHLMAKPLVKEGIGAIILENPFYGNRKPETQVRSSLHYVSDIFVMGGSLILECLVLLNWCEDLGFGPLGVSGLSMGGHMASLAASNWPKPLVLVPCLSWSTASSVFTEGVMSESINWDMLQNQYFSNLLYCDALSKLCKIVDSPFACDLSKVTDYGFSNLLEDQLKASYVTPYEMLSIMDSTSCPAISYRPSGPKSLTKNAKYSGIGAISLSPSSIFKSSTTRMLEMKKRDKEAFWLMRGMMDEFTHLKNFTVPYDTSLIIAVCAKADGYVPRVGVSRLEDLWPGVTVKYVDTGHVGAYLWHTKLFRRCIVEAFEKAKKIVPPPLPE